MFGPFQIVTTCVALDPCLVATIIYKYKKMPTRLFSHISTILKMHSFETVGTGGGNHKLIKLKMFSVGSKTIFNVDRFKYKLKNMMMVAW